MFLNNVYAMFLKIAAVRIKEKEMFQIFSVYLKNETTPQLMWLHVVDYKKQGSAEEKRKKKTDRRCLLLKTGYILFQ